jgi:hypothetical protein
MAHVCSYLSALSDVENIVSKEVGGGLAGEELSGLLERRGRGRDQGRRRDIGDIHG